MSTRQIKISILLTALIFSSFLLNSHALSEKIKLSTLDYCPTNCPEIQKQERLLPICYIFPKIKEEEKDLAVNSIKKKDKVKDACITQDNENINLTLIVDYGVPKEQVKELGENFIRLVKFYSSDVNPEEKIGSGFYNYIIVVVYPNKKEMVKGTKANTAESIIWQK